MLVLKLTNDDDRQDLLIFVLEPGNFKKLKEGDPIHKYLNEFIPGLKPRVELLIAYTPDAVWTAEQIQNLPEKDAVEAARIIRESLSRPEIVTRSKSAEDLKKVF